MEQRLRWICGGLGCYSRYYDITHISLWPACTACNDMVYSKVLERDLKTTAMAKAVLCLLWVISCEVILNLD